MKSIQLKFFGITGDLAGKAEMEWPIEKPITCDDLLQGIKIKFPEMESLSSIMMAINLEYAEPKQVINPGDVVALIPPVSGG